MKMNISINDMKELADRKNGECLSDEYLGAHTKLKWKCSKGHVWEAKPNAIKSGQWCPECGGRKKRTIEDMKRLAQSRNGKCLSSEYINNKVKLLWQCKEGHTWEARPDNIVHGQWCPVCGGSTKLTIEDMRKLAKERGGQCLSTSYINNQTKLTWKCIENHIWDATPSHIKNGSWCPVCAIKNIGNDKRLSIDDMKVLAESMGGKCIATEYRNTATKIKWQCEKGHIWEAVPYSIKAGHWCPVCSNRAKSSIEEIQGIAKSRGGRCLSDNYKNNSSKLMWQCKDGHTWEATPKEIKKGTWCPFCYVYLNEEKCRYVLETLLGKTFQKTRNVLPLGYELDGYNQDLKLAFEYHGIQHYKFDKFFYKSKDKFIERMQRDALKKELCANNGIKLIVIPYKISENTEILIDFIWKELMKFKIRPIVNKNNFSFEDFYTEMTALEGLRKLADNMGGKCISTFYTGDKGDLEWECSEGHRFIARPNNVKNGHWCPICAGLQKGNIKEMNKIAERRGGKCLSTEYVNNKTKLKWQCSQGHVWEATPRVIKRGKWCPICKDKK